jgi:SMODS and SLOG-associating 2TM effector domain 1
MGTADPITIAAQAIGEAREDDHIDPAKHVTAFDATAHSLATVLSSTRVESAAADYRKWDDIAIEAQAKFKKYSNRAGWSVFIAATASAALLSLSIILGPAVGRGGPLAPANLAIATVAFIGMAAGVISGVWFNIIRTGGLLQGWMKSRAEAEARRLLYFAEVTGTPVPPGADALECRLLQLEYFRRYQLDAQRAFYARRGAQHEGSAQSALVRTSLAMGGVALANALSGYLAPFNPQFTAIAGAAVLSQAMASKITNREAVNQDGRNAERYKRVESSLNRLWGKLDDVRRAVANGDEAVLSEFVFAVNEQLSHEHRQWLEEQKEAGTAVGRLEAHLEEIKPKLLPNQ